MVPQKHREASKFIYNSGFFITRNIYPDFGSGLDGEAIKKRLAVFETKSLPKKDTSVSGQRNFKSSFIGVAFNATFLPGILFG